MNKLLALAITIIIVASCIGLVDAHSRRSIVVLAKTETGKLWYDYRQHAVFWQATITDTVHVDTDRWHNKFYYSQGINWDQIYGDRADVGWATADAYGTGYTGLGAIGTLKVDAINYRQLSVPNLNVPTDWILKVETTRRFYWRLDFGMWRSYTPYY